MKTLTIALILASLTSTSFAWDTSKNPDRFVSVGLHFDYDETQGGYGPRVDEDNYLNLGENVYETATLAADLRVPVTNRLTLEGRVRGITHQERFNSNDQDVALNDISDMSGSGFGVSVRYYFAR